MCALQSPIGLARSSASKSCRGWHKSHQNHRLNQGLGAPLYSPSGSTRQHVQPELHRRQNQCNRTTCPDQDDPAACLAEEEQVELRSWHRRSMASPGACRACSCGTLLPTMAAMSASGSSGRCTTDSRLLRMSRAPSAARLAPPACIRKHQPGLATTGMARVYPLEARSQLPEAWRGSRGCCALPSRLGPRHFTMAGHGRECWMGLEGCMVTTGAVGACCACRAAL